MNRTWQLGFLFLGGAALVAASLLGFAVAQVNCETLPAGPGHDSDCANFTRCQPSKGPRSDAARRGVRVWGILPFGAFHLGALEAKVADDIALR